MENETSETVWSELQDKIDSMTPQQKQERLKEMWTELYAQKDKMSLSKYQVVELCCLNHTSYSCKEISQLFEQDFRDKAKQPTKRFDA